MSATLKLDMAKLFSKEKQAQAAAQALLKNEVAKGSDKYVPFQNGVLRKSVQGSINTPEPRLVYDCPYARYQYYGRVMVGRPPKTATNTALHYHTAGTGPQWFEKWKAADGKATVERVKKAAGKYFNGK